MDWIFEDGKCNLIRKRSYRQIHVHARHWTLYKLFIVADLSKCMSPCENGTAILRSLGAQYIHLSNMHGVCFDQHVNPIGKDYDDNSHLASRRTEECLLMMMT